MSLTDVSDAAAATPLAALLELARDDLPAAWAELERRYGALVRHVARRRGVPDSEVDDVAQHTWLQLFRHLDDLADPDRLSSWLITTARRESRVVRTRCERHVVLAEVPEVVAAVEETAAVEDRLMREQGLDVVRAALPSLPPRCRDLLGLMLAEPSVSYAEISRRLQMPIGTIGPTRLRCVLCLQRSRALKGWLQDGPKALQPPATLRSA
jgi:RNA polymerase sigma factor (sigma-70 family)